MKNTYLILIALLAISFTGCEPMEDVQDEINAEIDSELAVGTLEFELTEDDYDELGLNFPNFNNVDQAKELIPGLLSDRYPTYGPESQATITFDIYSPAVDERSLIVYEANDDDYATYGDDEYDNWDGEDQIYDFLNGEFPDAENRTLVSLTYDYYDGGTQELHNGFLLIDGEWEMIPGITQDEYEAMGEGYANFSSEDEADEKLPVFLKEKFKYTTFKKGELQPIMYELYTDDDEDIDGDGSTEDSAVYSYVKYFIWNGTAFEPYNNTLTQTLKFGNIDGVWVPDNTIRYTFTGSDYAFVSSEFASAYPGPAGNVGDYNSFDVRSSSGNYWSDEMLLEAMNAFLDNKDPNAEEGQKYVVSFAVYNGAVVTQTLSLIKEGGAWVLFE